jgi:hypothetical protein
MHYETASVAALLRNDIMTKYLTREGLGEGVEMDERDYPSPLMGEGLGEGEINSPLPFFANSIYGISITTSHEQRIPRQRPERASVGEKNTFRKICDARRR